MAGGVRVGVAFDDVTLEPTPSWTYLTDTDNLVASYQIDRGRQFEVDRTDGGTANVQVIDTDGVLDPTNSSGPYFGKIEPLLQVKIDLWNPVTSAWSTRFRGFIDEFDYVVHPSQAYSQLTMSLVDAFEILAAIEMQPGMAGDTPPAGSVGNIFYDNANVDDRIRQALSDGTWPSALSVVFSGNVSLQETIYSPGETILQVVQDAADGEFPGVANVYVSRDGKVTFHGRLAKFDPVGVSAAAGGAWPFTHWKCGDSAAVAASISDTAQIRVFAYNRGLSKIINSALATPQGILDAEIAAQLVTDPTSIGLRGIRSWSAENLLTEGGLTDGLDADDETLLFATYYVDNYAEARNRVTDIQFRSMRPSDPRAAANWALLCGAEISDLIDVTVGIAGGGSFNAEPFFIEGMHEQATPLDPDYANVTLSLDLSPQAYFNTNPF